PSTGNDRHAARNRQREARQPPPPDIHPGRSSVSSPTQTPTGDRVDGRTPDHLREVRIARGCLDQADGRALIRLGRTPVLRAGAPTAGAPPSTQGPGPGWATAQSAMRPPPTNTRSPRESVKGKSSGPTHAISRLIGRSLRAVIDLDALGENTFQLDCHVLQ